MKIKQIIRVFVIVAIAAYWAGCGGSTSSSGGGGGGGGGSSTSGMSENEAIALSQQISGVAINGMNSVNPAASENSELKANVAKTVQCSQDGSTCTYNIPISFGQNCTAGGRIAVTGSITGSTSNGSGLLQIGATETITDWQCITGYIINGDPYITLAGTFSFLNGAPSTQQSMDINGGFKWGTTAAESCQIDLSINFNSNGSGSISGSVCGYTANASF